MLLVPLMLALGLAAEVLEGALDPGVNTHAAFQNYLEIERQALKKEDDANSRERLATVERDLAEIREKASALRARWTQERESMQQIAELKKKIDALRHEESIEERKGNFERVAQIRYGELPALEKERDERQDAAQRFAAGGEIAERPLGARHAQ